jgi:ABC-type uncharacterized transport system YnjBCD substrate-binding protein
MSPYLTVTYVSRPYPRTDHLALATTLTQELQERLKKAINDNNQISNAWGVPERINAIISRFNQ